MSGTLKNGHGSETVCHHSQSEHRGIPASEYKGDDKAVAGCFKPSFFSRGTVSKEQYCDLLQLQPCEFELIKSPERGRCLYRCGNERYLLLVQAPEYKARLFGTAGGR